MKIIQRELDRATVLALKGKIKIGSGDIELREAIDHAVTAGARNVVLDLKGVSRIDSSGLGELVDAHKRLAGLGGRLGLTHMSGKVLDVMGATRLISVLDVYDTEEEALASFG